MANRRGRGGKRSGQPGKAYGQRADLNQAPRVASGGKDYGEVGEAEARQQAVPLPRQQPVPTPAQAQAAAAPNTPPPLTAPSTMPGQPVTAGLPIGAGPGPSALAMDTTSTLPEVEQLLAIYRAHPTVELARLIERIGPA